MQATMGGTVSKDSNKWDSDGPQRALDLSTYAATSTSDEYVRGCGSCDGCVAQQAARQDCGFTESGAEAVILRDERTKGEKVGSEGAKDGVGALRTDWFVLVNTKSGGRHVGHRLLVKFAKVLPSNQVCNLAEYGSLEGILPLIQRTPNAKVLIAGGNGTSQTVMTALEHLDGRNGVTVGLVPIGVGNDLGRVFGWLGAAKLDNAVDILHLLDGAQLQMLDRWQVSSVSHVSAKLDTILSSFTAQNLNSSSNPVNQDCNEVRGYTMSNYFTIGPDARVIKLFDSWRSRHPSLFFSRRINMCMYFLFGFGVALSHKIPPLREYASIFLDDSPSPLALPSNVCGIIVSNLPSIFGGIKPWGKWDDSSTGTTFSYEPVCDDGLFEITGINNVWHLGKLLLGSQAVRLGQARKMRIVTTTPTDAQIDGEPVPLPPSVTTISHKSQQRLLYRPHTISNRVCPSGALPTLLLQSSSST